MLALIILLSTVSLPIITAVPKLSQCNYYMIIVPSQLSLSLLQVLIIIISKDEISLSGFSDGGFFGVQFHVAFSETIMGVGIAAGGNQCYNELEVAR